MLLKKSLGHPITSENFISYRGHRYPYSTACSPNLAEDAQAIVDGDAGSYTNFEVPLATPEIPHGIYQTPANAFLPQLIDMAVDAQVNGPFMTANQTTIQHQHNFGTGSRPKNNTVHQFPGTGSLQCAHGCTGTFGRNEEYRRHMKKHTGPFFPCPNCGKMFYRQDKLRDHFRQGHGL
jgi:predicted RNA-binding Zn-ribbon protein involved in translation (DUF1610 family)